MNEPTKILIVDDHILFREGLASLIGSQTDFIVVGEAGSVKEACQLASSLVPDLILMDFSLPDGTGAEATRAILEELPDVDIVFITVHDSDEFLMEAVCSGAKGYLLKNLPVVKLLDSLRGLARDEAAISRQMTSHLMKLISNQHRDRYSGNVDDLPLTAREIEVLRELAIGASNQEIAGHLCISINTVKNHVHNILQKLELDNRRQLAKFAVDQGYQRQSRDRQR
jgi:two-component system nitrate/nitrite response regulator NarL